MFASTRRFRVEIVGARGSFRDRMADDLQPKAELEIAHVLFIDVVAYSSLRTDEQTAIVSALNQLVRDTPHFRSAETAGKLIRIPTGDGMALVFSNSPEAPVQCALELAEALRRHSQISVRMGIHSGPVDSVADVNDRSNVAGVGVNIARRIMDCADAGHILVSKRIAEDLLQHGRWRDSLHDLGEIEIKHGATVSVFNLYGQGFGNPQTPSRMQRGRQRFPSRSRRRRRLWIGIGIAGSGIMAAILFLTLNHRPPSPASMATAKSIAVLPFDNFSDDKESSYFADGIQDDILTALSKIADLKVISRGSVMHYRGGDRNLRRIGGELNVAHVLEGSVRRVGDGIRVTAQLIDARTDTHVWAEHYDRKLSDVFAIQSEVSESIVAQLRATLSPAEKAALSVRPTNDLEAFDLFLQGKELITTFNDTPDRKATLLKAIRLMDEAIARDSRFALALCWAAIAHDNLYWFDLDHTPARLELAKSCVRQALEQMPDLGEAHLVQALIAYHGYRDYARARENLAIARKTLPNSAEVYSLFGYIDRRQGHWDDSLKNLERAAQLDPRNFKVLSDLSVLYDLMRRYDDKEALYDRAIAINPTAASNFQLLRAETAMEKGDLAKARRLLQGLPATYDPDGSVTSARVRLSLYEGDLPGARAALAGCKNEELVGGTGSLLPRGYFEGQIARAEGDRPSTSAAFSAARERVEAKLHDDPDNALLRGLLCVLNAGLGRKDPALIEGHRAVELLPISKDAVDGPVAAAYLAKGYAWLGDTKASVDLLNALAGQPGGPDYGELKLDPAWKEVRADPRYQQMLTKLQPPSH